MGKTPEVAATRTQAEELERVLRQCGQLERELAGAVSATVGNGRDGGSVDFRAGYFEAQDDALHNAISRARHELRLICGLPAMNTDKEE